MKTRKHSERIRLAKLLLASFLMVVILLVSNFLITYPSIKQHLIDFAEYETEQIANHLAKMIHAEAPLSSVVESPKFNESVKEIVTDFKLWKLKVFSASGLTLYSTESSEIGQENRGKEFSETIAQGKRFTQLRKKGALSVEEAGVEIDVVETYIPIMRDGHFIGAFEIYYDITHFTTALHRAFFKSVAFMILLCLLFFIFLALMARSELRMISINVGLTEQLVHSEKLAVVGQLAAGVAHEFNNVLNNISMGVQRLLAAPSETTGALSEESVLVLKRISSQIQRGANVASDVLALSKPSKLSMSLCSIEDVIDESIQLQLKLLRSYHIEVVKDYAYAGKVFIDSNQMQQVFLNLVVNATHAIYPLGKGNISISVQRVNEEIEVRFSDTGIGIASAEKYKIFTPFYSTKGAYAKGEEKQFKGTGLGLAISYRIVQNHHGNIRFESEEGKGTTFIITLPLTPPTELTDRDKPRPPLAKALPAAAPDDFAKKLRILIVDDEEIVVEELGLFLKNRGYPNVVGTCSAQKALEYFKEKHFDLVFVDLLMPDMPGEELMDAIVSIEEHTRFIIASGQVNMDQSQWIAQENVLGYLSKPFDFQSVLEIIHRAYAGRDSQKERNN